MNFNFNEIELRLSDRPVADVKFAEIQEETPPRWALTSTEFSELLRKLADVPMPWPKFS